MGLDDVWPLVYSEKSKAVRALKQNFIDGEDFTSFAQNGMAVLHWAKFCAQYFSFEVGSVVSRAHSTKRRSDDAVSTDTIYSALMVILMGLPQWGQTPFTSLFDCWNKSGISTPMASAMRLRY